MIPTIANECSQFISESDGKYLVKNLPVSYQGFSKVKVRFKKQTTDFIENFNEAFKNKSHDLHQRAIFAYTDISLLTENRQQEPFYIFPINGYKVLFNPLVQNSENDFQSYEDLSIDGDIITDQLKISYEAGSLCEAMDSNCEVVLYGIKYYYAIRSSLISDYKLFFSE
jgi:hypothetical protein